MKSYLKFLSRNTLYTAIEAVGLIVSLAFVIIIFCYTWQQLAITREAPDYKRLYAQAPVRSYRREGMDLRLAWGDGRGTGPSPGCGGRG